MIRRRINWKLALVLVLGFGVLTASTVLLHRLNRTERAKRGLSAGTAAFEKQQWQEAAENFGRYIVLHPDHVESLLKYGQSLMNIRPPTAGNIQQAISAYRNILRLEKGHPEAVGKLAEIYLRIGAPQEAENILQKALAANDQEEFHILLAQSLAAQSKPENAWKELQATVEKNPHHLDAWRMMTVLAQENSKQIATTAKVVADEAIRNNPESVDMYLNRAKYYVDHHQMNLAQADLLKAQKLDLTDRQTRIRLVHLFMDVKQYESAETVLMAMREEEAQWLPLWTAWASFAQQSKDPEKMKSVASEGLQAMAGFAWDFYPEAIELFIQSKEISRAEELIRTVEDSQVDKARVERWKGLIAEQNGQLYAALDHWKKAIQLGQKKPQMYLSLAYLYSRLGNMPSALLTIRQCVQDHPQYISARCYLGQLLFETGNVLEAEEQARAILTDQPDFGQAQLLYLRAKIKTMEGEEYSAERADQIDKQLKSLELSEENPLPVQLTRFDFYLQMNDRPSAETVLQTLRKNQPEKLDTLLAEAKYAVTGKDFDAAVNFLGKARQMYPQRIEPVRYLAMIQDSQKQQAQCEATLRQALEQGKDTADQQGLKRLLAGFYERWQESDKQKTLLEEMEKENPQDISILRYWLRGPWVSQNPQDAQKRIELIRQLEGEKGWQWKYEQAKLWLGQSDAQTFKTQYPQILSLLKENLLLDPSDQASRMLLVRAYRRGGESQLAASTCREAYQRSPKDLMILLTTYQAYHEAEQIEQAQTILAEARKQKPGNPLLSRLQLQSFVEQGDLAAAEDMLRQWLQAEPEQVDYIRLLARLKTQQGQWQEAEKLLDQIRQQTDQSVKLKIQADRVDLKMQQNQSDEAIAICDEIVQQNGSVEAYLLRAITFQRLKRYEQAAQDFTRALEKNPDHLQAIILNGDFLASQGDYAQALQRIEKAIAQVPESPRLWLKKARLHRALNQFDAADESARQALHIAPDDAETRNRVIDFLISSPDMQQVRKGQETLTAMAEAEPQKVDMGLRLYHAKTLLAKSSALDQRRGIEILEEIVRENPKMEQAWLVLAQKALQQNDTGKAIDLTLQGLAAIPDQKDLLLLKARAEAVRSPQQAIPTLNRILALHPKDPQAAIVLAELYEQQKQTDQARQILKEALVRCTDDSDQRKLQIAQAKLVYRTGNREEADALFSVLQQTNPEDPAPRLHYVKEMANHGEWDLIRQRIVVWKEQQPAHPMLTAVAQLLLQANQSEATVLASDILVMSLSENPDYIPALQLKGMTSLKQGNYSEACQIYQKLLEKSPNDVVVLNNLAWILCEHEQQYAQALAFVDKGLKLEPGYLDMINTRGMVYYRMENYSRALNDFTICVNRYPLDNPALTLSYWQMAQTQEKLGQTPAALASLEKALELNGKTGALTTEDQEQVNQLRRELQKGKQP